MRGHDEKYGKNVLAFNGDGIPKEYPVKKIRVAKDKQFLGFDPGQDLLVIADRPR